MSYIVAPVGTAAPAAPVAETALTGMVTSMSAVTKALSSTPTKYIDDVSVGRALATTAIVSAGLGARYADKFPQFVTNRG